MKNLSNIVVTALLLASPIVGAEEYPAADFKPKVLYKDSEYSSTDSKPTTSAAKSSSAAEDAQYPATNFQPKVLYKDDSYKPSASVATTNSKRSTTTTTESVDESTSSVAASEPTKAEAGSTSVYPIVLILLGIVGFVFLKKKSQSESGGASKGSERTYKTSAGLTGVAKYVNRVSGTGVARYLDKQVKSAPVTGVAKYVAKQVITAKSSTKETAASTGVEKYMRNRR